MTEILRKMVRNLFGRGSRVESRKKQRSTVCIIRLMVHLLLALDSRPSTLNYFGSGLSGLGLGTSLYVPKGHLIIAQQFTAGLSVSIATDFSPGGTAENGESAKMKLITSVVPPGLKNRMRPRLPSDKSPGYYQISLREKDLMDLIHFRNTSAK